MIKGKRLCFGYGDIGVGHNIFSLIFQNMRPPQELGTEITDDINVEYIGEEIRIRIIDFKEVAEFKELLEKVKETKTFKYKGYIFDFSNYHEKSIEVVKKHLKGLTSEPGWFFPQGC